MSFKLRIGAQFLHYCPEIATGLGLWVRRRRRSSTSRRDLLQDVAYKALQEVELVARSRQRVRALVRRLSRRRQRVAGRRLAKRGGLGGHQPSRDGRDAARNDAKPDERAVLERRADDEFDERPFGIGPADCALVGPAFALRRR